MTDPARLTFTQTPFTAAYLDHLAANTGLTKSQVVNTSITLLAYLVRVERQGGLHTLTEPESGATIPNPAIRVFLGDILTQLGATL